MAASAAGPAAATVLVWISRLILARTHFYVSLGTRSRGACSHLSRGERALLLSLVSRVLGRGGVGREAPVGDAARKALLGVTGTVLLAAVLARGSGS